jgi:hypothetical protein
MSNINNHSVTVSIQKELVLPRHWAMFTDEGNQIVQQRMCGLVQECNGEVTGEDVYRAIEEIWNHPKAREAGDTEVREIIFAWLRQNNVYVEKEIDNE